VFRNNFLVALFLCSWISCFICLFSFLSSKCPFLYGLCLRFFSWGSLLFGRWWGDGRIIVINRVLLFVYNILLLSESGSRLLELWHQLFAPVAKPVDVFRVQGFGRVPVQTRAFGVEVFATDAALNAARPA